MKRLIVAVTAAVVLFAGTSAAQHTKGRSHSSHSHHSRSASATSAHSGHHRGGSHGGRRSHSSRGGN